ncbi:hypothetical protein CH275_12175 [Rhodococcus sp. 06-235-1A]|uniref:hypothetical protein n=1 Tax=Rhodococcus sp. 06-235-1A TaxID=2022508 RepID=UPI000B9BE496|nr:hypothetical protein [Rhodococcus sp. 06-235-1A]OZD05120.1 hypothetical protein CH275_12175 [Rhodococcus sp. 06-235-1A]
MPAADSLKKRWTYTALAAIGQAAREKARFTAWTLSDEYGLADPPNPRWWGLVFAQAHRNGLIEYAGFQESPRPSRSRGVCRVWRARRIDLGAADRSNRVR